MSSSDVTASCATSTMTSPTLTPFSPAGLAGSTSSTITPFTSLPRPCLVRSSSVSGARTRPTSGARGKAPALAALSVLLAFACLALRASFAAALTGSSSSANRPTATCRVLRWPLRSSSTSTSLPIGVCATMRGRPRMVLTSLPSNFRMMSPSRMPAFAAGLSGVTLATSAPVFSLTPEASARSLGDGLDLDAEPAAPRLAELAQLIDDAEGDLGGDGEADADRAAGRRDDGRVHADDLAVHVEQRAAGVALD